MRWDAVMVRVLARELEAKLGGARARAVLLDREGSAVLLCMREATLLFRLVQPGPSVALSPAQEPPAGALPLPAKIVQVDSIADERILRVHFHRVRGRAEDPVLVVEFGPRRPNAVLVGRTSGKVQTILKPTRGARPLIPGQPYPPVEGQPRRGIDGELGLEAWNRITSPTEGDPPRRALLRSVAWSSSVNAELILEPDLGHRRWQALARGEDMDPGWLEVERGAQPYPVPLPGPGTWQRTASFLEAVEAAASSAPLSAPARPMRDPVDPADPVDPSARDGEEPESEGPRTYVPGAAMQSLEADLDRARRTLGRLREELAGLPDGAALRSTADLLLARIGEIPRGRAEVSLLGFDGAPVTLRLDPTLDPASNARKLYDRAARSERAASTLPERIAAAEKRVARASALVEQARAGTLPVEKIPTLEGTAGAGKGRGADGGEGTWSRNLPYRRFRSSGGLEIRVGRGAKHNDDLTFRHSRPMDVWLHARSVGGAHVVLRWDSPDRPPARDLQEAAVLAALHSKARTSGSAPVDWTRRKWVRKPRGAGVGAVRVERAETLFVEPDPTALERLRDEE